MLAGPLEQPLRQARAGPGKVYCLMFNLRIYVTDSKPNLFLHKNFKIVVYFKTQGGFVFLRKFNLKDTTHTLKKIFLVTVNYLQNY